jgi:uncharacterized protein (DUF2236 family)
MTGYFAEDSMLRRVNRERTLALAGPRALLMQAAHPLAVAGLLAHSSALDEPYDRLARTAEVLLWVLFTLVDSAVVVYRKYVGALSRDEESALWEGYRRSMLEGDRLHVSPWARERARKIVLEPPVPWTARPLVAGGAIYSRLALVPFLPGRLRFVPVSR